ncbi:MAG: DEAD/DEAH box helicase family protein, partial [Isosphaeraceae bacterium]
MATGAGATSPAEGESSPSGAPLRLIFEDGTILVEGLDEGDDRGLPGLEFDPRAGFYRAEGIAYRAIVEHLLRNKIPFVDAARDYPGKKIPWTFVVAKEAFPHQVEGLDAWWKAGARGVVVLPTGTGKTHLANLAIARAERHALIVTPTIDLMNQWYDELTLAFGTEVGLIGGGSYDVRPITVTTYDSAHLHMGRLGNKFGLIVFDECHHLPGPTYGQAAVCSIAP